jgi:hypothetical protein
MMCLYAAVGLFAAGTLAALAGVVAPGEDAMLLRIAVGATFVTGGAGFLALVIAAGLLVAESQLAYRQLREEANQTRLKYRSAAAQAAGGPG